MESMGGPQERRGGGSRLVANPRKRQFSPISHILLLGDPAPGLRFTLLLRASCVRVCTTLASGTKLPRVPYPLTSCSALGGTFCCG